MGMGRKHEAFASAERRVCILHRKQFLEAQAVFRPLVSAMSLSTKEYRNAYKGASSGLQGVYEMYMHTQRRFLGIHEED